MLGSRQDARRGGQLTHWWQVYAVPSRPTVTARRYEALLGTLLLAPLAAAEPMVAAPPALSRTERAIVAEVDHRNDEALALLERVVNVNSGTHNFAGVREVGKIFAQQLEALGFTTRWADGAGFGRAGHLLAERPGNSGSHGKSGGHKAPHVLLIGHLDTVFDPDSPFQRFEKLDGNRARGPGVIDMKGGDVVLVHALAALSAAHALDDLHVTVYMGGDEEDSGTPLDLARRDLVEAARGADVALGFEDGDGVAEHAVVVRRGAVDWTLRTTGTPAHSSQIFQPEIGAGAIYEAAHVLDAFYNALSREPNLTFNPGMIVGGTTAELAADATHAQASGKTNVVAGTVVVNGDLRTISPEQLAQAKARMQEILTDELPGTTAQLTFGDGYPPMAATPGNLALLAMLDQASRDLGLGPVTAVNPRNAGAADVSFVAAAVPRCLDALGMKGTGGHTVEETGELGALRPQTQKAALLLYRLGRGLPPVTP